jgi:bromodomain and WD repeat domain containing protein 1/3
VAGSNDNAIRVYFFDLEVGGLVKVGELESHTNVVDSIVFANNSARFLSGSKDGTARIWRYEERRWKTVLIDVSKTNQK